VVRCVTEGAILFEIEREPARTFVRGDAFLEPAKTRITHFDNATDAPARFVACYSLAKVRTT
jgi:quercetin dioxygenase-like cupin family protein